jgi:hypothetical protein
MPTGFNQQGQPHVKSADGLVVFKVRTELTIQLGNHHGHLAGPDWQGNHFEPWKLVVTSWPHEGRMKAKVQAYGRGTGRGKGENQCTYALTGYDTYKPVPTWIARLIREFGYQWPIERME